MTTPQHNRPPNPTNSSPPPPPPHRRPPLPRSGPRSRHEKGDDDGNAQPLAHAQNLLAPVPPLQPPSSYVILRALRVLRGEVSERLQQNPHHPRQPRLRIPDELLED